MRMVQPPQDHVSLSVFGWQGLGVVGGDDN